ncbi:MAG: AMP-binding protein [Beijerinckiaceae bacterium]|nr:AMP-binding protein [Beijerinckiaceae bacterium]
MDTVLQAIEGWVQREPERVFAAFVTPGRDVSISYGQLWKEANVAAALYRRAGASQGSIIVIMLKHSPRLYSSFLGAMICGAIPTFMPYPTPKQDETIFFEGHAALFERMRPDVVVTFEDLISKVRRIVSEATYVLSETDFMNQGTDPVQSAATFKKPRQDDIAFLQHSSGTTGLKKGVMLTHRAVLSQVRDYVPSIELNADSTIVSWLPLYHDMGLIACLMLPLITGAHLVHMDPFEWVSNPLSLLEKTADYDGTHIWVPNFALNHMVVARKRWRGPPRDLSTLVRIINCSEPCKAQSMMSFADTFADWGLKRQALQVCYAMAETVFAITQSLPGPDWNILKASPSALADGRYEEARNLEPSHLLVSCGAPISNMTIEIRNSEGKVCSDGTIGEICATGASVYDGYYKRPDATALKFRDGWHHTGDLGFLHRGELFVIGRIDDLLIVRGRNFYAHEIESIVCGVEGVKPGRATVFAIDNESLGTQESICLFEPSEDSESQDVRRQIKMAVESHSGLILGKVVAVQTGFLIKTTSGKISREANRRRFLESSLA